MQTALPTHDSRRLTPAAFRSLVLLAICGASLVLCVQELHGSWLEAFIKENALAYKPRVRLIASLFAGAGGAALVGVAVLWRRGAGGLRRLAHVASPSVLAGAIPPLWQKGAWPPLETALAILGVVLLGERCFRLAFAAGTELSPPRAPSFLRLARARALFHQLRGSQRLMRWLPVIAMLAAMLGYCIYMSVYTLRMHGRFQTFGYDLGQYDNIFFSALNGHPMRCAPLNFRNDWEHLRGHAELSLFVLLPFYALSPGAHALLVIQSCVLGLGAVPLYRFASRRLPRSYAVAMTLAYLMYAPMHGFQFYDFHFQPIASTFVLFVIDFLDERRYLMATIATLLALGCREDISLGLATLGLFLALTGYRVRPGLLLATVSALYFVVMRFVIMPRMGQWGFPQMIYKDLLPAGMANYGGIMATVISNPVYVFKTLLTGEKVRYALQILLPIGLLPLRKPYLALSLVPGSLFTLLSTQYVPTLDLGFQYSAQFIPYIFPAAAVALAAYGHTGAGLVKRRAALAAVALGTTLTSFHWGAIPPRELIKGGFHYMPMTAPTPQQRQMHKDLQELHAMVPEEAWLAMGEVEMPHVSRLNMSSLRDTFEADYILYMEGTGYYGSDNAAKALESGRFEKIAERPGLALLKRKDYVPPAPKK